MNTKNERSARTLSSTKSAKYQRMYRDRNKKTCLESEKRYRDTPEAKRKAAIRHKKWKEANKEKNAEYQKEYNKKHRNPNNKKSSNSDNSYKKGAAKNKQNLKECWKRYRAKNKEKIAEYNKAYNKEYNKKNKEKLRKQKNEYYRKNKEAVLKQQKEYYRKNKEKIAEYNKEYNKKNKEVVDVQQKKCRKKNKQKSNQSYKKWAEKNKEKVYALNKKWRQKQFDTNPLFKITQKLRRAVTQAFRRIGRNKSCDTQTLLGCSYQEAKAHIESLFQEGMSWENHGVHTWHIDHIRPVSTFGPDEIHLMNHITNLQPLWAKENIAKSNKYNK